MSAFKGTPGPWVKNGESIYDANGTMVALTITGRLPGEERHHISATEKAANLRAIVALPLVIEALERLEHVARNFAQAVIDHSEPGWDQHDVIGYCADAREALAQALGTEASS